MEIIDGYKLSVIDNAAVCHRHRDYNEFLVFEAADDSVVPDAVSPVPGELVAERLTRGARIDCPCDTLLQEEDDLSLDAAIQFGEIPFETAVDPERPAQT